MSDDAEFDSSYRVLGFISLALFIGAIVCAVIVFVNLRKLKSGSYQNQEDEP